MKGVGSLVWAVLVGGVLLGFGTLYFSRTYYGRGSGPARGLAMFKGVREIDAKAMSRLEDLGLEFAELAESSSREPTLDLNNPTEADFRFLEGVLASNDPGARVSAARVLRDIAAPRSVEPLLGAIRGIEDIDRFMLECALTVLNRCTDEQRIHVLVPAWQQHEEELPDFAKEALRLKLRDLGALDPAWLFSTAVNHADPRFRRFAVCELASSAKPPAGVLAAALADADPAARECAGKGLER